MADGMDRARQQIGCRKSGRRECGGTSGLWSVGRFWIEQLNGERCSPRRQGLEQYREHSASSASGDSTSQQAIPFSNPSLAWQFAPVLEVKYSNSGKYLVNGNSQGRTGEDWHPFRLQTKRLWFTNDANYVPETSLSEMSLSPSVSSPNLLGLSMVSTPGFPDLPPTPTPLALSE